MNQKVSTSFAIHLKLDEKSKLTYKKVKEKNYEWKKYERIKSRP